MTLEQINNLLENKDTKHRVFYSFCYDDDNWRVSQIKEMGVIEGDELVSPNEWEKVWKGGDTSIKNWINKQMKNCSCVVVLIGEHTSERPWVQYEIKHAVETGKALAGIYIHNLKDSNKKSSSKGNDPFFNIWVKFGKNELRLSNFVECYEPNPTDAYNDIKQNLKSLVEKAVENNKKLELV